jgi:phage shock protein A
MQQPSNNIQDLVDLIEAGLIDVSGPNSETTIVKAWESGDVNAETQINFHNTQAEKTQGFQVVVYNEKGELEKSLLGTELLRASEGSLNDGKELAILSVDLEISMNEMLTSIHYASSLFLYSFDLSITYGEIINLNEDYLHSITSEDTEYYDSLEEANGIITTFKPNLPVIGENFVVDLNGITVGHIAEGSVEFTFANAPEEGDKVGFRGHASNLDEMITLISVQRDINALVCANGSDIYTVWESNANLAITEIDTKIATLEASIPSLEIKIENLIIDFKEDRKKLDESRNNPAEVKELSQKLKTTVEEIERLKRSLLDLRVELTVRKDDKQRGLDNKEIEKESNDSFTVVCSNNLASFEAKIEELETLREFWEEASFGSSYDDRMDEFSADLNEQKGPYMDAREEVMLIESAKFTKISETEDFGSCEGNQEKSAEESLREAYAGVDADAALNFAAIEFAAIPTEGETAEGVVRRTAIAKGAIEKVIELDTSANSKESCTPTQYSNAVARVTAIDPNMLVELYKNHELHSAIGGGFGCEGGLAACEGNCPNDGSTASHACYAACRRKCQNSLRVMPTLARLDLGGSGGPGEPAAIGPFFGRLRDAFCRQNPTWCGYRPTER